MGKVEFTEPTSVEDCEARQEDLKDDVRTIQAQLSDKDKCDEYGNRMTNTEYWKWKRKATFALSCKHKELSFLKLWLKQENRRASEVVVSESNVDDLLHDLYLFVGDLRHRHDIRWSDLSLTDRERLKRCEGYLRGIGRNV